ncbi:MAG: N-acetylmuramoyl-L-alanine amidase, partial [Bacteroidota bacterium]
LENADNIIYKGKLTQISLENQYIKTGYGFVVTAFDRLHNESLPGTVQWLISKKTE